MNKPNALIALYIALFFGTTQTMDIEIAELKDLKALLWIDRNTLALASTDGFFLLKDVYCPNRTLEKIHDYPTHNLTTNQTISLIGSFCTERFIVYNATTFKETWSKQVYNNNYSATFGPNESIFLRNDEALYSNLFNEGITLPFTGGNNNFGIAVHPTKLKIAYPSHSGVITKRSVSWDDDNNNNKTIQNDYFNDGSIPHSILHPIYTPDGKDIILRLEGEHIFIYDAKNKSKIKQPQFMGRYFNIKFFDESTLALMFNHGTIDFFDCTRKTIIAKSRSLPRELYITKNFANIFDFSPHKRHFAAIFGNKIAIRATPLCLVIKQFVFIYWLMQQNFCNPEISILPREVVQLIMQCLIAPHRQPLIAY